MKQYSPSDLSLSTVTPAEILYGIEKSPEKKKERHYRVTQILSLLDLYPFDETAARKYAVIRAQLENSGNVISERDLQTASIAAANKLVVVTHNIREFVQVDHLSVEDWST